MNRQLILREWKEKIEILLFALSFLLAFVVAALVLAKQGDVLDILTSTYLIAFLPVSAALIGASAFSSEFKDGAWAYLLSRPLKKSTIWISKFAALFALVAALLLISFAVLSSIPSLSDRIRELSLWGPCIALSLSLFVIAFSLSFLTEKQFQVIFLSLLVFAGLSVFLWALIRGLLFLNDDLAFLIPLVWVLMIISIGAASLTAFCRTDFSQSRAKAAGFIKTGVLCLALAGVVVLSSIWIQGRFFRMTDLSMEVRGGNAYITSSRGFFRYDTEQSKLKRLLRRNPYYRAEAAGGKVAWFEIRKVKKGRIQDWEQELWIMDEDGRNRKPILRASELESLSHSVESLLNCTISPDGRRIICFPYILEKDKPAFWSLNSDGTGLRSHAMIGVPYVDWYYPLGWSANGRHIILNVTEKQNPQDKRWLNRLVRHYRMSVESGAWQAFPDRASGFWVFGLSPEGTQMGLLVSESAEPKSPRDVLAIFDIESMEETDILRVPGVQFIRWNPDGERVVFFAEDHKRIGVVSLTEKRIIAEKTLTDRIKPRVSWTMDWVDDGRKIALSDLDGSRYVLRVFDETFKEERVYPIPRGDSLNHIPVVYGLGQKILVLDGLNSRLWVFDLAKEKWRRLF